MTVTSWKQIKERVKKPLKGPTVPFLDMLLPSVQCQLCKKLFPEPEIQIHHLNPKSERPDLKRDPDNLVVLCNKCHREMHDAYDWLQEQVDEDPNRRLWY